MGLRRIIQFLSDSGVTFFFKMGTNEKFRLIVPKNIFVPYIKFETFAIFHSSSPMRVFVENWHITIPEIVTLVKINPQLFM